METIRSNYRIGNISYFFLDILRYRKTHKIDLFNLQTNFSMTLQEKIFIGCLQKGMMRCAISQRIAELVLLIFPILHVFDTASFVFHSALESYIFCNRNPRGNDFIFFSYVFS